MSGRLVVWRCPERRSEATISVCWSDTSAGMAAPCPLPARSGPTRATIRTPADARRLCDRYSCLAMDAPSHGPKLEMPNVHDRPRSMWDRLTYWPQEYLVRWKSIRCAGTRKGSQGAPPRGYAERAPRQFSSAAASALRLSLSETWSVTLKEHKRKVQYVVPPCSLVLLRAWRPRFGSRQEQKMFSSPQR
jgi:hypothetical protein